MKNIYNILEVANCHAGDISYVLAVLQEFDEYTTGFGVKFQPLAADKLATSDYPWYEVYKQLEFSEDEWATIFVAAKKTKDIWLDLYDDFSAQIFRQNFDAITGVKLQASALDNLRLRQALRSLELTQKFLILNLSGFALDAIQGYVRVFKQYKFREIILQIGCQRYPTEIVDSGLNKLDILRERFSSPLSFADHSDAGEVGAIFLPILAIEKGCRYIEKHIMHSTLPTKYDYFSALTAQQYKQMIKQQQLYESCMSAPFVNSRETEYLSETIQLPVFDGQINKGQIPSLTRDLAYKRTPGHGLRLTQIERHLEAKHILANTKYKDQTVLEEDFKQATVATLVACRMKSTRLKDKAIVSLGALSTIETCLKNCLRFENVAHTVLATSTHPDDACLADYTYSGQVLFRRGDPDDVIQRYLTIACELNIDIIVRVTGDMPYVSPEIFAILLDAHFDNGADYTCAENAAIGTSVEIYNVETLLRIKEHIPNTHMSEYMTFYVTNNQDFFKINRVRVPPALARPYRLTLDYPEDLEVFRAIQNDLDKRNAETSLAEIFTFLDRHPEVAMINNVKELKYVSDTDLVARLKTNTKFR